MAFVCLFAFCKLDFIYLSLAPRYDMLLVVKVQNFTMTMEATPKQSNKKKAGVAENLEGENRLSERATPFDKSEAHQFT